jgi:hypothetical protein
MPKKVKPSCGCLTKVQAELKKSNLQLDVPFEVNFKTGTVATVRPCLAVKKIDPKLKKKLPTVCCSHCPFCGVKYPE